MTLASRPGRDAHHATAALPLVVAVDRTLISCDLARETLVAYLKLNPRRIFDVLGWLWRGRVRVKRQLAERVPIDASILPVNETLATFAKAEAAAGRRVFLAISAESPLSGQLEKRFPFVEGTITARKREGSKASAMADVLAQRFPEGFEYAGSSTADLDVWRRASSGILVGASSQVQRRAAALVPISANIPGPSHFMGVLASLRLHQWAKNLLVFAPIVLGGQLGDMRSLLATVVSFLALGLVASSTYLINDILDVADDRRHWSKRERPIAKGLLRASSAAVWAGVGLAAGLALAVTV